MAKTAADFKETMFTAVSQSIENMAFMEVSHGEELPTGEVWWTRMTVTEPLVDCLYLGLPAALLRQLTASVMGQDETEVDDRAMRDTLNELLNTLGGLFFTAILPSSQTYQLGLPEFGESAFPKSAADPFVWRMRMEETPIVIAADGEGLKNL